MNKILKRTDSHSLGKNWRRMLGPVFALLLSFPSTPAIAQDFTTEDTISTYAVSFGFVTFAIVGITSIAQNSNMTAEKNRALSDAELAEARDELLEYQANGESGLKDYQVAYLYPMLNKYLKQLRKLAPDNENQTVDGLVAIAIEDLLSAKN